MRVATAVQTLRRLLPGVLLGSLLLATVAGAQVAAAQAGAEQAAQPGAQQPHAAAADTDDGNAAAAAAAGVSLQQAYKQEHALLAAQRRELQQRLDRARDGFQRERDQHAAALVVLESQALAARAQAEQLAAALARSEQEALANADNSTLVAATLEQAAATLQSFGTTLPSTEGADTQGADNQGADNQDADNQDADNQAADNQGRGVQGASAATGPSDAERLRQLFAIAQQTLEAHSRVRQAPGRFHLSDGSEVEGTLVQWGNVAQFGVGSAAAGALAPAGGGRFRLWSVPAEDSARALASGQLPNPLRVFLYENANASVEAPQARTLQGEVAKGGVIGWIIVLLGLVALLLAAMRAVFLHRAGARIASIIDAVSAPVRAGDVDAAIAGAKRFKGSAARVVTAALRNLDRDREHLEDIVSESILHESTHLNRFGSLITVIAAVAPLLGLLGTVTGMIQTFDVITEFGTSDPKLLSGGIAVALVTTELGLVVAIPAILLGSMLNGWAERIKDDMEGAALRVINLFQDVRGAAALDAAA